MKKQNFKAFTLIELLVVVSIIALLVSILMPALARAREQAKQVLCATNLHSVGQAFYIYAAQNNDWIPLHRDNFQLHDISYKTSNFIIDNGGNKGTFYCPSNAHFDSDDPRLWQYAQLVILGGSTTRMNEEPPDRPTAIPNFSLHDQLYRVTSYHWLMETYDARRTPPWRPDPPLGRDYKIWPKTINEKLPSSREVVVDQVLSDGATLDSNFTDLTQGYMYVLWKIVDDTNHMNKSDPTGGNILFLDGHVEFREITQMQIRAGGGNPWHWW